MALRYLITHLSRADSSMGERILTLCMCLRSGTWLSPARSLCKQFVQCLSVCAADTIPDRWHQSPRGIGCVLPVLAERAVYREGGGGEGGFGGGMPSSCVAVAVLHPFQERSPPGLQAHRLWPSCWRYISSSGLLAACLLPQKSVHRLCFLVYWRAFLDCGTAL